MPDNDDSTFVSRGTELPASAAIEQVRAKGYDAPYRGKGLPIYLVGLGFDSKTRHLADAAAVSA